MHRRETLKTVDEVVDAFGGPSKAAEWCGIGNSAVSNWFVRGFIPPGWHYRMATHLRDLGFDPDPAVWGVKQIPKRRRRAESRPAA